MKINPVPGRPADQNADGLVVTGEKDRPGCTLRIVQVRDNIAVAAYFKDCEPGEKKND